MVAKSSHQWGPLLIAHLLLSCSPTEVVQPSPGSTDGEIDSVAYSKEGQNHMAKRHAFREARTNWKLFLQQSISDNEENPACNVLRNSSQLKKYASFKSWPLHISKTGFLLVCQTSSPRGLSHAVCSAWNSPPHLLARLIITFPSSPFLKSLPSGSLSWLFRAGPVSCSTHSEHHACCLYSTHHYCFDYFVVKLFV